MKTRAMPTQRVLEEQKHQERTGESDPKKIDLVSMEISMFARAWRHNITVILMKASDVSKRLLMGCNVHAWCLAGCLIG